jgi:hypothetical protein
MNEKFHLCFVMILALGTMFISWRSESKTVVEAPHKPGLHISYCPSLEVGPTLQAVSVLFLNLKTFVEPAASPHALLDDMLGN